MKRSEKPASDPSPEELEQLGSERRPIAAWLEKLAGLRAEVSASVFERVRSDYEGRLAGIDRRAAPLVREARKTQASIDSGLDGLDAERRGLDLDLQELTLRHSLAELTDDELAERNRAPRERIEAIEGELERAKATRERWRAAIEQGFAAAGDEAAAARAPQPPPPAPAAPPPPAPAGSDAEPRRIDITMPQPIPPPRASSPAVPLPGPPVVEAAARTAYVAPIPVAPPPPPVTAAGDRTAFFSPSPPSPPSPPAAEAAGRTSVYAPSAPPPPPSSPSEAAGRTSLFSPAPPPERTVVFGSVPPPLAPPAAAAAAVPKARLVPVESTGPAAKEHPLAAENTLGRVPENSIPVPHGSVSRHHATLRYADGAWWIVDQKSENGTWVNGERVTERKLGNDDRINIGTVRFRFRID